MGVSRLDPQHPYLVLWERPGWGGSTVYSSLSHLEHTTLPEEELHWAATGLVPRAPQLCKEVKGVNSETLSRSCMFCQKNRKPIISPRTSEEALAAHAASASPAYLRPLGHPKGQMRGHLIRIVPGGNSHSGLGTNTLSAKRRAIPRARDNLGGQRDKALNSLSLFPVTTGMCGYQSPQRFLN